MNRIHKIKLYNSFSRKLETLAPVDPDGRRVTLYTCGPTVYNFAHIVNMRTYVWEDFLVCTLKYFGSDVTRVLNITDVDDKTIRDAQQTGVPFRDFTERYTKAFFDDWNALCLTPPDYAPHATDFIPQIIELIEKLIANGHAYVADGSVYYRIATFPAYGNLSGRAGQQTHRHRVSADEYDDKEGVSDFALWKAWKPEDGEVKWSSPWGDGRPGWHIECSTMAMHYLGDTLDIHCGGKEHLFPHHENEIAQSEGATGKRFVNIWLHGEWLQIDTGKMSKSLGNFFTLSDLMKRGFSPRAFRYYMLAFNYRMPVNFSFEGLQDATKRLQKFDEFWYAFERGFGRGMSDLQARLDNFKSHFETAVSDDLNSAKALGVIAFAMTQLNGWRTSGELSDEDCRKVRELWRQFDSVFGVLLPWESLTELSEEQIDRRIVERTAARKSRNFTAADAIRKELQAQGIILEDTPTGTVWRRK